MLKGRLLHEYYFNYFECKVYSHKFSIALFKGAALPEFNPIIAEYTIKDPAFNIVSDLFKKT